MRRPFDEQSMAVAHYTIFTSLWLVKLQSNRCLHISTAKICIKPHMALNLCTIILPTPPVLQQRVCTYYGVSANTMRCISTSRPFVYARSYYISKATTVIYTYSRCKCSCILGVSCCFHYCISNRGAYFVSLKL